jgi:hypothetical protein
MNNLLLFIFVCMGLRMSAVYLAKKQILLDKIGLLYILFGLGIFTIYFLNLRETGVEVGGKKIWWDEYRPVFGAIWLTFGVAAVKKIECAWVILLLDIILGYGLFIRHRWNEIVRQISY